MMLIIYILIVGVVCENFFNIYCCGCGLFIFYVNCDCIDDLLNNVVNYNVKVIVVIDGECIFGFGD